MTTLQNAMLSRWALGNKRIQFQNRHGLHPILDAQFSVSQDIGDPTSASVSASSSTQSVAVDLDEKDEFEINAGLSLPQTLNLLPCESQFANTTAKEVFCHGEQIRVFSSGIELTSQASVVWTSKSEHL